MTNHPNRNRKFPFEIGQRVLFQNDLLKRTYVIVDVFRTTTNDGQESGFRVRAIDGIASLTADAASFIAAPEGWADAPERPAFMDHRFDFDMGWELFTSDPAQQAAINEWRAAFEEWDRTHRQPLLKRLQETGR